MYLGEVIVTCLPPVSTEGLTASDIGDLIERVRNQMQNVFDETSVEVQTRAKNRGDILLSVHPACQTPPTNNGSSKRVDVSASVENIN